MDIKVRDILEITKGNLIQGNIEEKCGAFAFDTREMKENDVYVGIKTENSDGSLYWEKAFEKGGKIVIINKIDINKQQLNKWQDRTIIEVQDGLEALQKIATYKREVYGKNLKVVAITGSVGKTSTKDMVANVIAQQYKTLKTQGNYNNHIGVPLTILRLKDEEVAVIEMGMNHAGELRVLTNIAKPDLGIITNIGTSHIGNLGSRENILKAKLEILEGMEQKEIIVNGDNDLLSKWMKENKEQIKIHSFAIENNEEVWAENIELFENSSKFLCHVGTEQFEVNVPVAGIHFVYNALCAATAGTLLNIPIEKIKQGIENFELTKKRMEISVLENGATIINDAYNASPESIKGAIETLEGYENKRKIAILGDIFELGEYAEKLHRKVGKMVSDSKIDILVCSGENSKYTIEEAKNNTGNLKEIKYFKNNEEIVEYLKNTLKKNDVALIKASNGMKYYEICKKL